MSVEHRFINLITLISTGSENNNFFKSYIRQFIKIYLLDEESYFHCKIFTSFLTYIRFIQMWNLSRIIFTYKDSKVIEITIFVSAYWNYFEDIDEVFSNFGLKEWVNLRKFFSTTYLKLK